MSYNAVAIIIRCFVPKAAGTHAHSNQHTQMLAWKRCDTNQCLYCILLFLLFLLPILLLRFFAFSQFFFFCLFAFCVVFHFNMPRRAFRRKHFCCQFCCNFCCTRIITTSFLITVFQYGAQPLLGYLFWQCKLGLQHMRTCVFVLVFFCCISLHSKA